jgi:hypothetical protein
MLLQKDTIKRELLKSKRIESQLRRMKQIDSSTKLRLKS